MGMISSILGGGGSDKPTLRAPGPEEQAGLGQLVRRGETGTQLGEAQVAALLQLIGPEMATQLQALSQLQSLLSGQPFTSPTTEEAIRRQRGTAEEAVRRQLGPGGEVSTPGRETLAAFGTQSEMLREQARSGEMQRLLAILGQLGPQGTQRAAAGFAEPSPGILRQTGVQERVGEFSALSNIAAAAQGRGAGGGDILSFLSGGAGGIGQLLSKILAGGGAGAGGLAAGETLATAMAGGGAFSDRRLKTNIVRVGTHPVGVGRYEYDLFGRHERGVMADELVVMRPDAVYTGPGGYLLVDYAAIGGR